MNESAFEIEFKKQLIVQLKEINKHLMDIYTVLAEKKKE